MKLVVLVTGGRDFEDEATVFATLDRIHAATPIGVVMHGGCREHDRAPYRGADGLAHKWATGRLGMISDPRPILDSEWKLYGRAACPLRNGRMVSLLTTWRAERFDVLCVAFPGGSGTRNCMTQARAAGVKVVEVVPAKC